MANKKLTIKNTSGKKSGRYYHASTNIRRNTSSFITTSFQNAYTDNDYDILEDLWANTKAGDALDTKMDFVFGKGIKPTVILKNPSKFKTEEQRKEAIDGYQNVVDDLLAIDNRPKIRFPRKIKETARKAKVFGRSVLAGEPDFASVPRALKPLHPRDLGTVFVHQDDWSLSSVRAFRRSELVRAEEMIYLVNMPDSPRFRSMHYGFSELQRVAGVSVAKRQITETDGPKIAENLWANYGILTVDTVGKSESDAKAELNTIREGMDSGVVNLLNGKKDDFNWFPVDLEPKIAELMQLCEYYDHEIIGNSKVPAALLGSEAESNMATLLGKIRLFLAGPVQTDREWISEAVSEQWYNPMLKLTHPELVNEIEISAEFEPIVIESWVDNIDSLVKLKVLFPALPDEDLLKIANLEELTGKIKSLANTTVSSEKQIQLEELAKNLPQSGKNKTEGD